jgi:hypothetical protein
MRLKGIKCTDITGNGDRLLTTRPPLGSTIEVVRSYAQSSDLRCLVRHHIGAHPAAEQEHNTAQWPEEGPVRRRTSW